MLLKYYANLLQIWQIRIRISVEPFSTQNADLLSDYDVSFIWYNTHYKFYYLNVTLHITVSGCATLLLVRSGPGATWRLTGGWCRRRDWRLGTLPPGGKLLPTQQLRQHPRQGRRCPAPFQLTGWKWLSLLRATFLSAPASHFTGSTSLYLAQQLSSGGDRRERGRATLYKDGSAASIFIPLDLFKREKSY